MRKQILFLALAVAILSSPASADFDRNLYFGLRNDHDVTTLQTFLRDQGLYNGPITGNFLSFTKAAVQRLQRALGIIQTGYFGSLTRRAANGCLGGPRGCPSPLAPTPSVPTVKNGLIAYEDIDSVGTQQIYTVTADGTNPKQLTSGTTQKTFPKWSPNGKNLAYVAGTQIHVMDPDGTNDKTITTDKINRAIMLAWSPDSKQLAYVPLGELNIHVVNSDDTNDIKLTIGGRDSSPNWSPDGKKIIFVRQDTDVALGRKIWSMNADGTNQQQITSSGANLLDFNPQYFPRGKKILFMSNRGTPAVAVTQLYTMDPDGNNLTILVKAYYDSMLKGYIQQKIPSISPDGKKISFFNGIEMDDRPLDPTLPREIWKVDADGTNLKKLDIGDEPTWSPDGAFIIWPVIEGCTTFYPTCPNPVFWYGTLNADGSNKKLLFKRNSRTDAGHLSWQPVKSGITVIPPPPPPTPPPPPPDLFSSEPQYLLFQLFTYQGGPYQTVTSLSPTVDKIISVIGATTDGKSRQLGIAFGALSLDQTDTQLRTSIQDAFKLAEDKNVAVAFHIDDSMFWINRSDLWGVSSNVEWSNWAGTVYPHRYVDWVGRSLAPQMCYNSSALKAEISRIARDVIAAEITKGVDHLKLVNKRHLFAGVIAGWETHLADLTTGYGGTMVNNLISNDGLTRKLYGYCSLSNLGFNASNTPTSFSTEIGKVVHDWAQYWAQELNAGGISKNRIYTHFADRGSVQAFNRYARPGFTAYDKGSIDQIKGSVAVNSNPRWAVSEGTNIDEAFQGYAWEAYLANIFNNGGAIATIFGWTEGSSTPYGKATNSAGALAAYQKFLRGEALSETATVTLTPLQQKIQKIFANLGAILAVDPNATTKLEQILKYQDAGQLAEAEALANQLLALIGM